MTKGISRQIPSPYASALCRERPRSPHNRAQLIQDVSPLQVAHHGLASEARSMDFTATRLFWAAPQSRLILPQRLGGINAGGAAGGKIGGSKCDQHDDQGGAGQGKQVIAWNLEQKGGYITGENKSGSQPYY